MLIRIVKLSFEPSKVDLFLNNFHEVKDQIRNFPGNKFLELYQDKDHPNLFFTYSYWEHESDLENYRHSELFKEVWQFTKQFFNDKPQAWSVERIASLP